MGYMPTCKHCKTKFIPKYFNQKYCLSTDLCIKAFSDSVKQQKEKKQALERKKEKSVLKDKLKTLTDFKNEAKKEFQKFIRLRDKELPCISCGTKETDLWDGGHYKKAELYSGVIFNEKNVHKQCRKCNRFLGGNELNYRDGLIQRYSLDYVQHIENLANETRQYKWTKNELIAIKIKYQIKIKEIEKRT